MAAHTSTVITGARVWQGRDAGFVEQDLVFTDGMVADRAAEGAVTVDGTGKWG